MGLRARRPGPRAGGDRCPHRGDVDRGHGRHGPGVVRPDPNPARVRRGDPHGEDVFSPPFEIGSQEVTSQQANDYIAAVDAASDRVISGTAAQSVLGKDLNYAIVGEPQNVTTTGLAAIQGAIDTLRDPQTSESQAHSSSPRTRRRSCG